MTQHKKTSWVAPAAVFALLILSGSAYWWQNKSGPAKTLPAPASAGAGGGGVGKGPAAPIAVEAGRVESLDLAVDAQAVGTLRARQSVLLKPEVSGRIVKLGFVDGQPVRKGQVLVQLDDSLQAAQLQQAEAQASIASANLKRNRELLAQNFVSASVVDQALSNLQVAEAQVALSRAQLGRMQVRAPFDGVAGIRAVNLGDYVKDGSDLVGLEDSSSLWVDFRLPERFVPQLKLGQAVELALDALPGRNFKAKVEALDTQLEANGRSLLVRAKLDGVHSELRSGLFARVRVLFATHQNALLVPEEALVPQGGKQYIIKLVPGEKGGAPTAQRMEAKIGLRLPGKVELLEGVQAGDRVVTAGQAKLLKGEGQVLTVVDVDKQGAARTQAAPAASSAASKN
ncbi:efflux transporter periplasmic adaptor subunit [Paucibacter sp. KBW04]|uniref:efflux RND transporter periplasmic adaptor subunit n=1 Tax=Paucibacter sp. KBW04 TaxID=2153361 RepID=UPI000F56AC5B|nr:efflux RND transporter periplasmic adaptor subunit [Paucibacter sp. KBW04]RQO56330.1 efflux transporter periplasmic adaptor subunit [Paucibacter sp. KBW04]